MNLTAHFTLEEMITSDTAVRRGLDNSPPADVLENLYQLASLMERVRSALGDLPISISSGYRSPKVNALVGGSPSSQHLTGHACDFNCHAYGTPYQVVLALIDARLPFDQIINEYGRWVHISWSDQPRGHILTKGLQSGYTPGLKNI